MAKPSNVISHWDHLFENFQGSPQEFYASFEKATEARAVPELHGSRVEHKEGGLASAKREYLRMHRGKHAFDICAAPFGTGFFVSWWFTEPALKFAFLYLLAFLFGLVITCNVAYGIGFALGIAVGGFAFGILSAACALLIGIPLLLWFLGNALRKGIIPGESTVLAIPILGWVYEWIFAPETFYSLDTAIMFQKAVHNAVLEVVDCMTTSKGIRGLTETERKPIMKRFAASASET
jgi:hypothetical protein